MRSALIISLVFTLTLNAKSFSTVARVDRIDPVTQTAEIEAKESLPADREYRVLNEAGEMMGWAKDLKKHSGIRYSFTFEGKRRALSAGRRIVLSAAESSFSALVDRPRAAKEPGVGYNLRDKVAMQFIPEGLFILGSSDTAALHFIPADREGRPGNRIDVAAFFIDRHEVTVGQYTRYLEETRQRIPDSMVEMNPALPLTHMTYREAEGYCAWTGKRLPTELEWEKAARGTQIVSAADETYSTAQSFPVPEAQASQLCVSSDNGAVPVEVDKLRDGNAFGLTGMCGNAAEWTSSWLLPYRGNTRRDERFGKRYKVIRGGSYELPLELAKSYARLAGGIPSLAKDRRAGFRCARSE